MKRYVVDEARDDTGHLRNVLHRIARDRGRVINVIWRPEREGLVGETPVNLPSGYLIVSEYDDYAPRS